MNTAVEYKLDDKTDVAPVDIYGNRLYAHIVNPPHNLHIWRPGMTSADVVNIAKENNLYVISLCEKKFYPMHSPDNLDACPRCFEIAGVLMAGAGE